MVQKSGANAVILTLLGAAPFIIADWFVWFPFQPATFLGIETGEEILALWHYSIIAIALYGAGLLCFLSGSRWGGTIGREGETPDSATLWLSVLMALFAAIMAFICVLGVMIGDDMNRGVAPFASYAMYALAAGYLVILAFDVHANYPIGYVRARIVESIVGALSLGISAWYIGPR
ncbi:MAG: hypothetical protein CMK09_16835 [Ponticaulis sp.]|nr:hypothetical protein [Ponticaulis sp.]|tara:strand:- start:836 stop:1363 length:528 start_codon:yes stop_codon:yes gene_type:complete